MNPAVPPGIVLNATGAQVAYILSFPGAGMFQDYDSVDWNNNTHSLNAAYQVGKSYDLKAGVFGESVNDGALLQLSLYYRDGAGNKVTVGATSVVHTVANFPSTNHLVDCVVCVPVVRPGDAWAGQKSACSFSRRSASHCKAVTGIWTMSA